MLSSDFKAVGIGHAKYNGADYWVQEFGAPVSSTQKTDANDKETSVKIAVAKTSLTEKLLSASVKELKIGIGKSVKIPKVSANWNGVELSPSYKYTIKDTSIAEIKGNKITGKKTGETKLTISTNLNGTKSVTIPVKVTLLTQTISARSVTKVYGDKAFSLEAKAQGKLSYKTSDPKVAAVSKTGRVTLKGPGKAVITITAAAKDNYGKATKKITVTVNPKKVTSVSVSSSKKRQMTVKWKKDSKVTGYQIVYAKNSKFTTGKKTVTVSSYKTVKKTISKLSGKKTYYVKVRAYKKSGRSTVYGAYSTVKKVKVK